MSNVREQQPTGPLFEDMCGVNYFHAARRANSGLIPMREKSFTRCFPDAVGEVITQAKGKNSSRRGRRPGNASRKTWRSKEIWNRARRVSGVRI